MYVGFISGLHNRCNIKSTGYNSRKATGILSFFLYTIKKNLASVKDLWRGASKYSLASLDTIQKRAIRLIDDSALTDSLDSLAHRRDVSALSFYYRYYHGSCSDELKSIIPPKSCFARSTRFADSQHSFAVKLEKCRTTSFANEYVCPHDFKELELPPCLHLSQHL